MRYSLLFFFLFFVVFSSAQQVSVNYVESDEDFINPERGFYIPTGTAASNFARLDEATLREYRDREQRPGRASYGVRVSLIYRGYEMDTFRDGPLSDSFLLNLQHDFDVTRRAGLKMIIRFMYTNRSHAGNCPGKDICPPYGDAPPQIVFNHIRQLKPLLRKNADVIFVLQQGFVGIWGENYFTDYFGDASTNGANKIFDSSWQHRNELLRLLLDAMPLNRMVQVRTPQMKQKYVYGPSAEVDSAPLDSAAAYDGSHSSRIGFHNDCFLASEDDYGTYYDNGSSTQQKKAATAPLREYIMADTRYTVVGGETCDDAFSPQNDCAPAGYAEQEMRSMHYSYLNAAYNNQVNNDWDSAGCLHNIRRQLGYRFVLKNLKMPTSDVRGRIVNVRLTIENKGYAALVNPRPVIVILREAKTSREYRHTLKADVRRWFAGENIIEENLKISSRVPKGTYKMFLALPDESESISKRPEYSIRFANEKIFEAETGYMNLNATLHVR